MDLQTILRGLKAIGPVLAAVPEVQDIARAAGQVLGDADQQELSALLDQLRADNDAGHARLQAKLAEAARR